jgi:hypothetical protein
MKKLVFTLVFGLFFVGNSFADGSVSITEIMYNPEGSDTGREWVEIYNAGSAAIDLTDWKFFEADTNHEITHYSGSATVASGAYAVIASDPAKFKIDFPSYSGAVYDSSFSLSNTGETLALKKEDAIIDSVTYSSSGGIEGESINKSGSSWTSGTATPGSGEETSSSSSSNTTTSSSVSTSSGSSGSALSQSVEMRSNPQLFVKIESMDRVVMGAPIEFKAVVWNEKKEIVSNSKVTWNMGDGTLKKGEIVFHTFSNVGKYVVVADVYDWGLSASTKKVVEVLASEISISNVMLDKGGSIEIYNSSGYEMDISSWVLRVGGKNFVIPKNTYIVSKQKIVFVSATTGLDFNISDTSLLYPNGEVASKYLLPVKSPVIQKSVPVPSVKSTSNKNQGVVVEPKPEFAGEQASVVESFDQSEKTDEGISSKWLWALFGIIVLSIGAVIFSRKPKSEEISAEDVEIVE